MSVLVSEWSAVGDLLDYAKQHDVSALEWKVLFFQIVHTLYSIHAVFPSFRHNDLKLNNVLLSTDNPGPGDKATPRRYHVSPEKTAGAAGSGSSCTFDVPRVGFHAKIWDFDFSAIYPLVDNKKLGEAWARKINIRKRQNQYYDLFFLCCTSLRFKKKNGDRIIRDRATLAFIDDVAPPEFRDNPNNSTKNGRVLTNVEYTTPQRLLLTHPYFNEFRTTQ